MKVVRKGYEPILFTIRRLRKMMEKAGTFKELRNHDHYIKPSEKRRRKEARRKHLAQQKPEEHNANKNYHGLYG